MEIVLAFLEDYSTPELFEYASIILTKLETMGMIDHIALLENIISSENLDEFIKVDEIYSILNETCKKALSHYHVVINPENDMVTNAILLDFLDILEDTVEHDSILYLVNPDLDNKEQLNAWAEYLMTLHANRIDDGIHEVLDSLIQNVISLHEAEATLESKEFDSNLKLKIQQLKYFSKIVNNRVNTNPIILQYVKDNGLNSLINLDNISEDLVKLAINSPNPSIEFITLAIISDTQIQFVFQTARQLVDKYISNLQVSMKLLDEITDIASKHGDLCVIQNT